MQRVKARPLVPALGAADAVVPVNLDDLHAGAVRDLAQLALLVGHGLVLRADPQVDHGALHGTLLLR
jgi:hypothetical protein